MRRLNPRTTTPLPLGVRFLIAFCALGTVIAASTFIALLWPHGLMRWIWHLKPSARTDLGRMGHLALWLMAAVAVACAVTAAGLWRRAPWGRWCAVALIACNAVGDIGNAVFRGDLRTLIGPPIAALVIWYLVFSRRVRTTFSR